MNLTAGGYLVDGSKVLYRANFDVDGILRLYRHQMGSQGSSNIGVKAAQSLLLQRDLRAKQLLFH
jgi:hypothetical protein